MNEPTTDAYADCPPLTRTNFACLAARLASRAATWSADSSLEVGWGNEGIIERSVVNRFLDDMRKLLDHIDRQVKANDRENQA